jgi:hypothetical protein
MVLRLFIAVALLAAPGAVQAAGQDGSSSQCGLRSCKSMVRLHFGAYVQTHKSIVRVRVCALGRCRSARGDTLDAGQVQFAVPAQDAGPIRVSVSAYDRRGRLRLERTLKLTLQEEYANGPECGPPICYYGTARLTRRGRLVDAGPGLT